MSESTEIQKPIWKERIGKLASRLRGGLPFALGVFTTLIVIHLYHVLIVQPNQLTIKDVNESVAIAMASATPRPANSALVYQVIRPSLVLIEVESKNEDAESDFGLGSGVIVDSFGNILTSLHVIDGADIINITFADGTKSIGEVVLELPALDLAVLQALDTPLMVTPATLASPGNIGDEAFVVGNPFGLYSSISAGVISGFDRIFYVPNSNVAIPGMIQFDASANPGNSGGPLLNRNGHVIGIVTGILNPTDTSFFIGIGFAVPIMTAMGGMGAPPY
ncbi:MAG: trypsin-like peptidase domain-containing protein [Anaerolineales bacterium]|nr:trypsin-like peptidase domain-containing protein [Anaerolineales bacterium]